MIEPNENVQTEPYDDSDPEPGAWLSASEIEPGTGTENLRTFDDRLREGFSILSDEEDVRPGGHNSFSIRGHVSDPVLRCYLQQCRSYHDSVYGR